MIARGAAKSIFLALVAALAVALALGVQQVPQPWRGMLVVWLLVGTPLLFFVLRVLRHVAQLKATSARTPAPKRNVAPAKKSPLRPNRDDLRVIISETVGNGRYVIR